MNSPNAIAIRYLATWNEPDADRRASLVADLWDRQGSYRDPMMSGSGHADIARMIDGARAQFPGLVFTLRGEPDGHGPFVRFSWLLGPNGGAPLAGGTDVAHLDGGGHLLEVVGFLDKALPNYSDSVGPVAR
jgi:hypothetical protein